MTPLPSWSLCKGDRAGGSRFPQKRILCGLNITHNPGIQAPGSKLTISLLKIRIRLLSGEKRLLGLHIAELGDHTSHRQEKGIETRRDLTFVPKFFPMFCDYLSHILKPAWIGEKLFHIDDLTDP